MYVIVYNGAMQQPLGTSYDATRTYEFANQPIEWLKLAPYHQIVLCRCGNGCELGAVLAYQHTRVPTSGTMHNATLPTLKDRSAIRVGSWVGSTGSTGKTESTT